MLRTAVTGPLIRRAATSTTTSSSRRQQRGVASRQLACYVSGDKRHDIYSRNSSNDGGSSIFSGRTTPVSSLRYSRRGGHSVLPSPSVWAWHGLSTSAAQREEKLEFQAETRQLLDIVTHSIYTDKEVFLRELISNASDAMEKLRHLQVMGQAVEEGSAPLEITITTNEEDKTITIQDTGIGMTREELKSNLGTIARSGSKAFLQEVQEGDKVPPTADATAAKEEEGGKAKSALEGIIGQFGVGFYSAFMVGDEVTVHSRSARDGSRSVWSSDGSGEFTVSEVEGDLAEGEEMPRGCKIVVKLREGCEEYCRKDRVEEVVKKYSNFVGVPIKLNGEAVNTVEAIWMKSPSEVEEDKYDEFYRFIAKAYDKPMAKLHFRTDAPIDLKALFYVPGYHGEKFGMERLSPGVSLYSRKVLIEAKCPDLLPEWLRFVKGVVDSEDLPLSISREKSQDTALLAKIGQVLTKKTIRFFADIMKKDPEKFKTEFFKEYGSFLKEGVCQDYANQVEIAKLLVFESNKGKADELCSLDEYVSRCTPEQKEIYYLCAPNRDLAVASPYFEAFKASGREVLFVYNPIDDFVMTNLGTYAGRPIKSAESEGLDLGDASKGKEGAEGKDKEGEETAAAGGAATLSKEDAEDLCAWLKESALPSRVSEVKVTSRLKESPAIISSHESGAFRKMMRMVEQQNSGQSTEMPKQKIEINPKHPLMVRLHRTKSADPNLAQMIAEQVFDNSLVAAGLMDDSRVMLPRLNQLMAKVLGEEAVEEPAPRPSVATPAEAEEQNDSSEAPKVVVGEGKTAA